MARLHRRNFLPTVIVNCFLWGTCGLLIYFTNPENFLNIILFFVFFFLALFLTLALIFGNTRRGFLVALGIVGVLIVKILCFRS